MPPTSNAPQGRLRWWTHKIVCYNFSPAPIQAEEVRDALLATSGLLDLRMGGKTVPLRNRQFVFNHTSKDATTYESTRRALYLPIIRNNL